MQYPTFIKIQQKKDISVYQTRESTFSQEGDYSSDSIRVATNINHYQRSTDKLKTEEGIRTLTF